MMDKKRPILNDSQAVNPTLVLNRFSYRALANCRRAIFLAILFLTPPPLHAQPLARVGIGLSAALALHDATFDCYSGGPACGTFRSATALNPTLRLFADIPTDDASGLWLTPRLWLYNNSVTLNADALQDSTRLPTGEYVTILRQGRYRAHLTGLGFMPAIAWEPAPGVLLGAGPEIIWLPAPSSSQTEDLISPLTATYPDGSRTKTVASGTIVPFNTLLLGAGIFAGTRWELSGRLSMGLELTAEIPFTSASQDFAWKAYSAGLTVWLGYVFRHAMPDTPAVKPPVIVLTDTPHITPPPPPPPTLSAKITARGIDAAGKEFGEPVIEIEEALWRYNVPLLSYVFFDSASSVLPARYSRLGSPAATRNYAVTDLPFTSALDIHRQMLNIVAERMRLAPGVTLTISGTLSSDEGNLPNARKLAAERARAVRDYLTDVWGIAPGRISVSGNTTPTQPTSQDTPQGREENRRAELVFSDQSITAPVVIQRRARVASPPAIRFLPEINADTTVAEWNISVEQGGRQLLRFEGSNETATLRQTKLWPLADMRIARDTSPITYRLFVRDTTGQTATATGRFRVTERVKKQPLADSLTGLIELDLVGFPYNSTELPAWYNTRLAGIIPSLTRSSVVQITGYTDRTGDPLYNRQLSLARARAVQESLAGLIRQNRTLTGIPITAEGMGSQEELFSNALPEGRLLSRMVRITITRPALGR